MKIIDKYQHFIDIYQLNFVLSQQNIRILNGSNYYFYDGNL